MSARALLLRVLLGVLLGVLALACVNACSKSEQVAVDGGSEPVLQWYTTCGAPVCGPGTDGPTGASVCTSEQAGDACESSERDARCDPGLGCGVDLVCSDADPKLGPGGCPISRARYKRDVEYLSAEQRASVADALLTKPIGLQLREEADAAELYGYTSMAVAALQQQSEQLRALERELLALRSHLLELEQRCPQDNAPAR